MNLLSLTNSKGNTVQEKSSVWTAVFENHMTAIAIVDDDLSIQKLNKKALHLFSGASPSNNLAILLQEDSRHWSAVLSVIERVSSANTIIGGESYKIYIVKSLTDKKALFILYFIPSEEAPTTVFHIEQESHLFKTLIQFSFDGIGILDEFGTIIFQSPASERILGFQNTYLLQKNAFDYISDIDVEKARNTFIHALNEPGVPIHVEIRFKTASGEDRWVEVTATNYLHKKSVGGIIINYSDIHEKRLIQHENWYVAHHDQLTDLPNRRYHDQYLSSVLTDQTNERPVYVLLDLDDFKSYNETIGNDIGDHLLKKVANLLSQKAKVNDGFVSRIGGDEFAVIFPDLSKKDITRTVEELMKIFDAPIIIQSHEYTVTGSMGASVYPSSLTANDIRRNASLALLMAKKEGKAACKIYDPDSDMAVFRSMALRNDLSYAIVENQFFLVYQPKYNTQKDCVGYEALIRWNHPTWGVVSPGEFILLAEETKLIVPIGEMVIRKVCEQLQKWRDDGLALLPVSLNVSAVQFLHSDLCEVLQDNALRYRIPPTLIQIEVTETVLLHKTEHIALTFVKLQKMGYKIALDDFGLGYSSLSYLLDYDVDIVKLDKRFAQQLSDQKGIDIVSHLIQLLKKIDVTIVIEGVETEDQFRFFTKMSCDEIQGYFLSKPLLPEQAIKLGLPKSLEVYALTKSPKFNGYIKGMLTIRKLHDKIIQTGPAPIFVSDAGMRSMKLLCKIRLPQTDQLVIGVMLTIAGTLLDIHAIVEHTEKRNQTDEWHEYTVSYVFSNEEEKCRVIKYMNMIQIANKKNELKQITDITHKLR
ncbi:putative bifunctional diguanylate cyclase/phosphodiesterase [Metabacillus indicus]|uniref:Diguanylate cyclase n=1 Tax=Metabacillus indicus TaxID=246786 RepID=A0A084GXW8_METID|nr:EAL domain-containing protein [Metabacillus indicus]KEZ52180.1 hypothetical protein GS18_0213980 [Metabacillus indicus]